MISVVICRSIDATTWDIDTWLMSCLVLGRKIEHMMLREILRRGRSAGICRPTGVYKPTDRNQLVVDHYEKLGFTQSESEDSGLTRWELDLARADPPSAPMKVVSRKFVDGEGRQRALHT